MSAWTEAEAWYVRWGDRYMTTRDVPWEIGREGSDRWFVIARGQCFDVTVPRVLRWIFDPHDARYLKAAALHDAMLGQGWSRLTAAAEFAEALRADGVGRARRLAMFLAVSLWRWS